MGNALVLVQLLLQLTTQAQQFSALLAKAHAEGRDVTDDELAGCRAADDVARGELQRLIDAKR